MAAVVGIDHTQLSTTADHERIPISGSTSRKRLEQNKRTWYHPFVNKRVSDIETFKILAGKSEGCVTIDVNTLHVYAP